MERPENERISQLRKLLAGLLALALPAAAGAETTAPVKADPALWVVKDDDTTIYLFGTVHVLRPGTVWFDGGVKAAYDASSEVVLEMIEPEPAEVASLVMQKAVDPDGPPLSQKLGAHAPAYQPAMATVGMPAASFEQFEPWFAATVLTVGSVTKAGFDPATGIEKSLVGTAAKDGKTLGEIESVNEQLDFFDKLSEPAQSAGLNAAVKQLPTAAADLDKMVERWAAGDPEGLAALMNKDTTMSPELLKILLTDRNARWADWIAKRLDQPGTVFVAVGAGHLAGANSVQSFLKARKLEAKRIPS